MKNLFTFFISITILSLSVKAQNSFTENKNLHFKRLSSLTTKSINKYFFKNSIKSVTVFYDSLNNWPLENWNFYNTDGSVGWIELNEASGQPYEGAACAIHNIETTKAGGNDWMVTSAINIANNDTYLSFWIYTFNVFNVSVFQTIILDNQNPENATIIDTVYTLVASEDSAYDDEWINPAINLDKYAGQTVYVGFRYYSEEQNGDIYALDEVQVYHEVSKDLAVSAINPEWMMYGQNVNPKIAIENLGKQAENSFTAKIEITDESGIVYTDLKTFDNANIEVGGSVDVEFKTWNAPDEAGNYNIKAVVILDNDQAPENDTLEQITPIVKFEYDNTLVYSHCTANPPYHEMKNHFFTLTLKNGTIDTLQGFNSDLAKLYGGDFTIINGTIVLMGIDFFGNIWIINGDGNSYYYGKVDHEFPENKGVFGFSWDSRTDEWYVTDAYSLYKLNKETLELETVGQISQSAGIIGIAIDTNGNMYGLGIFDDKLYSINKTTGVGTAIDAVGYNLNFAQDIGFDRNTNTLYGTLYGTFDSQTYSSALFSIDTSTAQITKVGDLTPMELSLCAVYKNYNTGTGILQNKVSADFNVYPNPANEILYVSTDRDISEIIISDITGKVRLKIFINSTIACIDISNIKTGIYIISVKRDDNLILNKKVIKK
jgi:hypothetical protein